MREVLIPPQKGGGLWLVQGLPGGNTSEGRLSVGRQRKARKMSGRRHRLRAAVEKVLATLVADVRAPTALKPVEAAAAAVPPSATCFAVNAYIYDEDPDRMYVTCRGRRGAVPLVWKLPGLRASPGAGLSVLDVSEPLRPRLLERWDSPNRLEGQDRRGELLVVTGVFDGVLYTFDASHVGAGPRGRCKLPMGGALHVRLHADAASGRLFALVTSGFAPRLGVPGLGNTLCAVDVSDAARPLVACRVRAGVPRTPEGIFVSGDTAYVGGCCSDKLAAFDLRDLAAGQMRCVATLTDPLCTPLEGPNPHDPQRFGLRLLTRASLASAQTSSASAKTPQRRSSSFRAAAACPRARRCCSPPCGPRRRAGSRSSRCAAAGSRRLS